MGNVFVRTGHRLGLTSNETAVVLFLCATACIGALLRSSGGPAPAAIATAYHIHDSTFAARAEAVLTDTLSGVPAEGSMNGNAATPRQGSKGTPSGRIDINKSSVQELLSLPGIGPSTAGRIVAYRTTIGPFERVEDIMNVQSIGKKKFEKIKPYLTISK